MSLFFDTNSTPQQVSPGTPLNESRKRPSEDLFDANNLSQTKFPRVVIDPKEQFKVRSITFHPSPVKNHGLIATHIESDEYASPSYTEIWHVATNGKSKQLKKIHFKGGNVRVSICEHMVCILHSALFGSAMYVYPIKFNMNTHDALSSLEVGKGLNTKTDFLADIIDLGDCYQKDDSLNIEVSYIRDGKYAIGTVECQHETGANMLLQLQHDTTLQGESNIIRAKTPGDRFTILCSKVVWDIDDECTGKLFCTKEKNEQDNTQILNFVLTSVNKEDNIEMFSSPCGSIIMVLGKRGVGNIYDLSNLTNNAEKHPITSVTLGQGLESIFIKPSTSATWICCGDNYGTVRMWKILNTGNENEKIIATQFFCKHQKGPGVELGRGSHGTVFTGKVQGGVHNGEEVAVKIVEDDDREIEFLKIINESRQAYPTSFDDNIVKGCVYEKEKKKHSPDSPTEVVDFDNTNYDIEAEHGSNANFVKLILKRYHQDLREYLYFAGPLTLSSILWIMKATANGTKNLHEMNIFHRDIKPQNVLIDKDENNEVTVLAVADIGMGIRKWDSQDKDPYSTVVTLWYRPPEVVLGDRQATGAIDIFSLGVTFVDIIRQGNPLFKSENEAHHLDMIFSLYGGDPYKGWSKTTCESLGLPKFNNEDWRVWTEWSSNKPWNSAEFDMSCFRKNLARRCGNMRTDLIELISSMLHPFPSQRPSAKEVIEALERIAKK